MSPSPFIPFDTQYSAHTDVTIHPVTGVVTITVAFHPNNRNGYNCKVWELPPPYTGVPHVVRDWVQGVASIGPFGHGASVALPTGGVLTCVPVAADSSEVEPSILIDMGLGSPYPLGGSSGNKLFPAVRTTPAWEGRTLTGGALVDVPTVFGVPSAPIYKIRFVAIADAPDIRVRAGTEACPFFVTLNTQFAGRAIMTTGETPGPHVYVSVVDGAGLPATARVWLQICGYST